MKPNTRVTIMFLCMQVLFQFAGLDIWRTMLPRTVILLLVSLAAAVGMYHAAMLRFEMLIQERKAKQSAVAPQSVPTQLRPKNSR